MPAAGAPLHPRVGVSVLVYLRHPLRPRLVSTSRVALIRRAFAPAAGLWSFPGGRLELGESMARCAEREAREETGLDVAVADEVVPAVCATDSITLDDSGRIAFHYCVAHVLASVPGCLNPVSGLISLPRLVAGDDAAAAAWLRVSGTGGSAELLALDALEAAREIVPKARSVLAVAAKAWTSRGFEVTDEDLR